MHGVMAISVKRRVSFYFARYYVAAGVRIYSQENWKIIAGNNGKRLVETFIKETVIRVSTVLENPGKSLNLKNRIQAWKVFEKQ